MFVTFISTELKQILKVGEINEDGSNVRELLMPNQYEEPDEDLFVPDNKLLVDLNVSTFYYQNLFTFVFFFIIYLKIKSFVRLV